MPEPTIAVHTHGKYVKTQCIDVILRVAQRKGVAVLSNTIQRDLSLQHFTCGVHRDQIVRRRIAEQDVSISYLSRELYFKNQFCIMGARILQALTREHPSTFLASTRKPVAVERTVKPVAVKLTSGFKDCSIQPSNSKITPARQQSKR